MAEQAPLRFTMAVDTSAARRKLAELGQELQPHKLLYLIGATVTAWIDNNFVAEGSERPWVALKAATIDRRRRGSDAILQDTGRLRQSFVIFKDRELSSLRGRGYVDIGTRDPRGTWHHLGTRRGLPARPIWPSIPVARSVALRSVEAYVAQVAKRVNERRAGT